MVQAQKKKSINPSEGFGVSWDCPDLERSSVNSEDIRGYGGITRKLITIGNEYSDHREVRSRRSGRLRQRRAGSGTDTLLDSDPPISEVSRPP